MPLDRIKRIVALSLPIMGGLSTYVLLELVDMLFVGQFGTVALAAVGIAGFVTFTFLALFGGASVAVQATTSRLVGEGETQDLARFLRTMLWVLAACVPITSAILIWFAPEVLGLMTEDPEIVETGTGYFRWLLAAGFLFTANSAFMGFWNATERADMYLRVVLVEAVLNAPLNYAFMFGFLFIPSFGVTGAGMGTFVAALVGIGYHIILARQFVADVWKGAVFSNLKVVLRLFYPASMQQFLDSLALTLMFRIVALIGTAEVAAYTVLIQLISAVAMPAWGLGLAGATLVGQAMGAKDVDAADQWAWDVIKVSFLMLIVLGMPFWLFPDTILGVFIKEEAVIEMARLPCQILGGFIAINGIGYVFASLLNGAGDVKRVMYVNLATQYLILLPGAYLFGVWAGFGLIGVWLVHQAGFRAVNSVILTGLWRQRRWQSIELW